MSIAAYQGVCPTCRYDHSADTFVPTPRETADHAELARLAEAAIDAGDPFMSLGDVADWGEFHAAANPATVLALLSEIAALRGERDRLRNAASRSNEEVCQSLGKALGYPWFKDDQANFPGSTEEHGVCVGDHVAESIADEAARRLTQAERQCDELRKALETARDVLHKHYVDFDGEPEDAVALGRAWAETEQALANQGADQ